MKITRRDGNGWLTDDGRYFIPIRVSEEQRMIVANVGFKGEGGFVLVEEESPLELLDKFNWVGFGLLIDWFEERGEDLVFMTARASEDITSVGWGPVLTGDLAIQFKMAFWP